MKFRITELMVVTAIAALTFSALCRADHFARILFTNFTFVVFLMAIAMAIGRKDGAKAFWIGFLVAGVLYFGFSFLPDEDGNSPRQFGPEATTTFANYAHPWFKPVSEDPLGSDSMSFDEVDDPFADEVFEDEYEDEWVDTGGRLGKIQAYPVNLICYAGGNHDFSSLMVISHSAWALFLGWFIGHVSKFVHAKSVGV